MVHLDLEQIVKLTIFVNDKSWGNFKHMTVACVQYTVPIWSTWR